MTASIRLEALLRQMRAYLGLCTDVEAYDRALKTLARPPEPQTGDPEISGHLNEFDNLAVPRSLPLVKAVCDTVDMPWYLPYGDNSAVGTNFAGRAAVLKLCGLEAPFRSELISAGFFVVLDGIEYFDHAHAPDEIYAVLAGSGTFWCDSYGRREAGPGDVLHHPSWHWHGMQTGPTPVLILWAWLGEEQDRRPIFR